MTELACIKAETCGNAQANNFDILFNQYIEVQDFYENNCSKILGKFICDKDDNGKYHFYLDENQTKKSRYLSSTSVCAYALCESYDCSTVDREKILGLFSYIITELHKGLIGEKDDRVNWIDEFTLLNALYFLSVLYPGELSETERDDIIQLINGLCYTYIFKKRPIENDRHPYIYYKFFCILENWINNGIYSNGKANKNLDELQKHVFKEIYGYGKRELYRQIALYRSGDKSKFDVRRLIYSLLIVTKKNKYSNKLAIDEAINIIFTEQMKTGTWPIGKVVDLKFVLGHDNTDKQECSEKNCDIFSYNYPISSKPQISSVECMNDMLMHENLKGELKNKIDRLETIYRWIIGSLRRDEADPNVPLGWYPEYEDSHVTQSWVAGHYLIFLKNYSTVLFEIIQDKAKEELGFIPYDLLEKTVRVRWNAIADSYKNTEYLDYLINEKTRGVYFSALLYGPPGSGKSTIAKAMACELQYGYIEITPGLFLKDGESNIIQNINRIFKLLSVLSRTVVFFDEVDQLVELREIGSTSTRWIVTALLPKLQELRDGKKVKFIMATNNIDKVDHAIKRRGRIDFVLPMGAMNWNDRLKKLSDAFEELNGEDRIKIMSVLQSSNKFEDIIDINNKVYLVKKVDFSSLKNNEIKSRYIQNYLLRTEYTTIKDVNEILKQVFKYQPMFDELFKTRSQYLLFKDNDNLNFHDERYMKFIQVPPEIKRYDESKILNGNVFCPHLFSYSDVLDPDELLKVINNPDGKMQEIRKYLGEYPNIKSASTDKLTYILIGVMNRYLIEKSTASGVKQMIDKFEEIREEIVANYNASGKILKTINRST